GSVPAVSEVIGARRDRIKARILARADSSALVPAEPEAVVADEAALAAAAAAEARPSAAESEAAVADGQAPAGALADAELAAAAAKAAAKAEKAAARKAARAAKDAASPEALELWLGLADELLARLGPREALAAALFESFGAELDPARYREIQETSVDAAGTARLFIGAGRRDGATPRALAAMVKRLTGIPDRLVGGIEVYENFSFLSVPFEAAERIIQAARGSGGLPPVRLATPRGAEEGGRPPRGPRGEGSYGPRRYGPGAPSGGYQGGEGARRPYAPRGEGPRREYGSGDRPAPRRKPKE
ncbi:MAG: DbpA RNA binding domain-containing protein, partial [Spirochaetaceae bacterium]|nr:DbpA RNA binding domain-containing protein [Spirochaetaceae bacterium]